jgi:hypothetical protein
MRHAAVEKEFDTGDIGAVVGSEEHRASAVQPHRSARLKGIAMINLDDVQDAIKELERAVRLGLSGAMITEYPLEHRRYDQSEYEPFWAAAAALNMPLSLHTATRRQGKIRGAGDKTLRDASSRATKAFYPALSLCDLIFSGGFERHPRLTLAIVEFELAWVVYKRTGVRTCSAGCSEKYSSDNTPSRPYPHAAHCSFLPRSKAIPIRNSHWATAVTGERQDTQQSTGKQRQRGWFGYCGYRGKDANFLYRILDVWRQVSHVQKSGECCHAYTRI